LIIRERIRRLHPIHITLMSIVPFQLITLGIFIAYSVQGLIGLSNENASVYYGNYFSEDADGSLLIDLASIVLLIAGIVVIILSIRTNQSRFVISAVVLFVVTILCTQSLSNNMISILLCFFAYAHLKKYPAGLSERQRKRYIPTALFLCYLVGVIMIVFPLIGYYGDLIIDSTASEIEMVPDGFEGEDVPEWLLWGTNSESTDIPFINQIAPILIYLPIFAATIIMYFGLRGMNRALYRLASGSYLFYLIPLLFIYGQMFEMYEFVIFLALPQTILSIWLFISAGREEVQTT
jgi:hypothetical protein